MRLLPGACLREVAISAAGAMTSFASRRSNAMVDPSNSFAQFAGVCIVSGAALMLATPGVLMTIGLGVPACPVDVLLIGLGVVVAAQAWRCPNRKLALLEVAYAILLIFAVPLTVVRLLA